MKNNNEKELVGVKEIARRANVSIATVDRVIHNRTGVSAKTKEKITAIIKELNYKPNLLARRLASRKTLELATLIPKVSEETDYWAVPLEGIIQAESEIKQYGVKVTKYFFDMYDKSSFAEQAALILKKKVDGVLLAPFFMEESKQFTRRCQELKIPFVFIDSDISDQGSLCYIGPDLYHSGRLAAHLASYLLDKDDKVLIVNKSKETEEDQPVLKEEEGFKAYFNHDAGSRIIKTDIRDTNYVSVERNITSILGKHPEIKMIFVTNSRVSKVAHVLEKNNIHDILLIGYDYLGDNIEYVKKGVIDFLICQKAQEQAYRGIRTLYQNLVFAVHVEREYYMPIDIITKENYAFYRN